MLIIVTNNFKSFEIPFSQNRLDPKFNQNNTNNHLLIPGKFNAMNNSMLMTSGKFNSMTSGGKIDKQSHQQQQQSNGIKKNQNIKMNFQSKNQLILFYLPYKLCAQNYAMICTKRTEIWTISFKLRIGQFDAQFGFGQGSYQRNRIYGDPKKIRKLIEGFFDSTVLRDYTKNICIL